VNESATRLFFALWPDDATRDALRDWQRICVPKGARKTHREDLHLTLHFLGQVPAEKVVELKVLGASQAPETFQLTLGHLGHFSRPGVLWAGPENVPEGLKDLHEDLGEGLRELDLSVESRPYRPHVTLARKMRKLPQDIELKKINWNVRQWGLVRSRPGNLPLYEPIAIWPIGEK